MSDDAPYTPPPTVCLCGHSPLEEFRADARDIPPTPHSLGCSECGRAWLFKSGEWLNPPCERCGSTGVIRIEREPDGSGGGAVPCVCVAGDAAVVRDRQPEEVHPC